MNLINHVFEIDPVGSILLLISALSIGLIAVKTAIESYKTCSLTLLITVTVYIGVCVIYPMWLLLVIPVVLVQLAYILAWVPLSKGLHWEFVIFMIVSTIIGFALIYTPSDSLGSFAMYVSSTALSTWWLSVLIPTWSRFEISTNKQLLAFAMNPLTWVPLFIIRKRIANRTSEKTEEPVAA